MSTARVVKNAVEATFLRIVIGTPTIITRNVGKNVVITTQLNFVVLMSPDTGPQKEILLKAQSVLGENPPRILIYFKQKPHSQKTSGKSQSAKNIQY